MSQKIILISQEHKNRAIAIIEGLPLTPVSEIIIREHKKNRSIDQNSLLWQWLTIIANELGTSKEEQHEFFKDKFLVNIYQRDNPDYAEMVQTLREVWKHGMRDEALSLRKRIVALTSTTTATVSQMQEYLENIERNAAELAIKLPFPEEFER